MKTSASIVLLATVSLAVFAACDARQGTEPEPKDGGYQEPKALRAKCGGKKTLKAGEETTIQSPGYPDRYPNMQRCRWEFSSEESDGTIDIECSNFGTKCKGDKFRLRDGDDFQTFCGNGEKKFSSKSSKVSVLFKSGRYGRDDGFDCTVRSVRSSTDTTDSYSTDGSESTTKAATTQKPATTTQKPATTTQKPATTTQKPATTTKKPAATTQAPSGKCQCGVPNLTRIVGGTEVNPANKYPWHVGLKKKNHVSYWCGATIINDRYALTAAHCFFDQYGNRESDEGLVVGVADHDMHSTTDDISGVTRLVAVSKVTLHPNYESSGYDNDIALLKLSEVLNLSKDKQLRSVCLPSDDTKTYAGITAVATGWGKLSSNGAQPSKLMEVKLPILEPSCWGKTVTARMLCAGYKEGGKDTCQGDSGGPLYVEENSKFIQVGITSFGDGCANANSPGVYARVSKFLPWIKDNTKDATYC